MESRRERGGALSGQHPVRVGAGLALLAALFFGVTAPLIQHASAGAGVFASGSLIYLGAASVALVGLMLRQTRLERSLRWKHAPALLVVSLFGGLVAPALLVLGLKSIDAATAALILALEGPLTLVFARITYREYIGKKAGLASAIMFVGVIVAAGFRADMALTVWGAVLVVGATLAWAIDNTTSRLLADSDPLAVVTGKGAIGGTAAALVGFSVDQAWPILSNGLTLLAAGAVGFGLSLIFYLRAQRLMGAARTASVFSSAPLLGAGFALLYGTPWPGFSFTMGASIVLVGILLHASERHEHTHAHEAVEHEHLHSHDDGHHDHVHDAIPRGPHSHRHAHKPQQHSHSHSEDLHHRHSHKES